MNPFEIETPYSYPHATGAAGSALPSSNEAYRVAGRRSNIVMGSGGYGSHSTHTASPPPSSAYVSNERGSNPASLHTDRLFEEMFGSPTPSVKNHQNNNNISTNPTPSRVQQSSSASAASPSSFSPSFSPQSAYSTHERTHILEGRRAVPTAAAANFSYYYDPNPQFGLIDSVGLRERVSKTNSSSPPSPSSASTTTTTTTDIIVSFKTLLSPPPPRDPNSAEIQVYLNLPKVRQSLELTYVASDGGYCRGARPLEAQEAASVSPTQHTLYWITPVKGLRFIECDVEVEQQGYGSPPPIHQMNDVHGGYSSPFRGLGAQQQGNIRYRVVRGTLLGYFHNGDAPAPTTDLLAPSPGRCAIWLPRGHAVCSVLDLSRARLLTAIRCKHCQGIVAQDESSYHLADAHPERALRAQQQQVPNSAYQPPSSTSAPSASVSVSGVGNGTPVAYPSIIPPSQGSAGSVASSGAAFASRPAGTPISTDSGSTRMNPSNNAVAGSSTNSVPFGATQGTTYSTYFGLAGGSGGGGSTHSGSGSPLTNNPSSQSPFSVTPQYQQQQNPNTTSAIAGTGSPSGPRHDFFGSPTVVAGAANSLSATSGPQPSVRLYTIRSPEMATPPVYFHRKSREVIGEHYAMFESLSRARKIGEGAQGAVSLCAMNSGQQLVVKDLKFPTVHEAEEFFRQCIRFNSLRHVHLISYLAVEWGSHYETSAPHDNPFLGAGGSSSLSPKGTAAYYVSILMPFYPDGDVMQLIRCGQRLEWYQIGSLGLQIASALVYLHTLQPVPVIHGDVKPDNILLYSNKEQCVLMDLDTATECDLTRSALNRQQGSTGLKPSGLGGGFGFDDFLRGGGSNNVPATQSLRFLQSQPQRGTMEWMSPEGANGKKVTTRSDVWSLGLVLFAMVTLPDFLMFENPTTLKMCVLNDSDWTATDLRSVLSQKLQSVRCPVTLGETILRMVVLDPERRYSSTDALLALQHASEKILLGEG